MIKLKHSYIGVRCSVCGKNVIECINSFQFASGTNITCSSCGAPLVTINKNPVNNLNLFCFACGETHTFTLSKKAFFSELPISFGCKENKVDVLFIGCYESVEDSLLILTEHINSLTEKYYQNLEKTYGNLAVSALHILEEKAKEKRIVCLCGSHEFNIKISQDIIHLSCPRCGSSETITVKSDKDITALLERRSILIK